MDGLTSKLSKVLALGIRPGGTAVSYAMAVGGRIIASDTLGTLNGTADAPAGPSATFNIGSVSKIYCTTAVMQLVDRGLVDLDRPVCEYLPRLWMPDERYKKITLRHCLSHSSGLPGTMWKAFTLAGTEGYDYYGAVYDYLSRSVLKAEPGEFSVYCNDGFTLAEMVVSEITGEKFEDYSLDHITEPLGAHSTRVVPNYEPDHPMVVKKGFSPEVMFIRGCGGYTSTMPDLCLFGEQFLHGGAMLSDESRAEMAKHQGVSFLKKDGRGNDYGLGWDNVAFHHPYYDLGSGVLYKSGRTLQFGTKFFIIPKYDAVIAMSATDDTGVDVLETLLRLFALAMLEHEGVSIYKGAVPVPKDMAEDISGIYLTPLNIMRFTAYGANCTVTLEDADGMSWPIFGAFRYDGEKFIGLDGMVLDFEKNGGDLFSLNTVDGLLNPMAQKAVPQKEVSGAWKSRIGKRYVVCDAGPRDLLAPVMFGGFVLREIPDLPGTLFVKVPGKGHGMMGVTEAPVRPIDDCRAAGFLRTPTNPGRDHADLFFDGPDAEFCTCFSYTFRDVDTLPEYNGEGFGEQGARDAVFRFGHALSGLPQVPAGRRLSILNDDLVCVWDSLTSKGECPQIERGFLIFA